MHDSRTVANRILQLAREHGYSLTPMQVLKLVYIAHGWMLGLLHRPLVIEDVQAWQYGPVIPRLYNAMRHYRARFVTEALHAPVNDQLDAAEEDIVRQVVQIYGVMNGPQLSRLTHEPGTPWAQTYREGQFSTVIPNQVIETHYQALAEHAA